MIVKSDCYIKKSFLILLILFGLLSRISAQTHIGDVVNVYRHVTEITGADNITLDDVSGFQDGDTVLLIQMKGVIMYVDLGDEGNYQNSIGTPGVSEFLIIDIVTTPTKNIKFKNNILNTYDAAAFVQLIRVPYYNAANVTSELTCQPWNPVTKTGGVLAMIIGRTLSLEANIDVAGKGFTGGNSPPGDGHCIVEDIALYDKYFYADTWSNSGYIGESLISAVYDDPLPIPFSPDYVKGKGNHFTGGGGGNGRFSGGGGGSNYGAGGKGGREMATCAPPQDGGLGGKQLEFSDIDGGIFLGSGGGGSTFETGSSASSGGNGGGIIIILCDTLKGNGKIISAEGGTPSVTATGNAGAGGGGAGGSVALYQQSFSDISTSALTISANGGNGGNNAGPFGEGGGGGGGYILTNNIPFPGNVSRSVAGGVKGVGGTGGFSGTAGVSRTSFAPILNGFLFNSIRSAVTGNQTDSICEGSPFVLISGTSPVGGVAPYTFLWEISTTSESTGFGPAPGINNMQDYTPGILTQTTWFRRKVTDSGPPVITDISKAVKVIFQPAIADNLVGLDATICYDQVPVSLIPTNAGPTGGSSSNYYLYKWIQNNTNTNWNIAPSATGAATGTGYNPPALTGTTYYQRVVKSGRCVSNSSTVTITVLPSISGNVMNRILPDTVICEGSEFDNLSASAPGGGAGAGSYTYLWQESETAGVWNPAANVNNTAGYTPDVSTFTGESRSFRRVVLSGPADVCRSNSSPIKLTRYYKIETNTIGSPDVICSGSAPDALTGSVPTKGKSGDYAYQWQDSSKVSTWATRGTAGLGFSPPALTDTTWYRRIVNSSACADTSLKIRVDVHKPVANNLISTIGGVTDTTICSSAIPHQLTGTIATGGTAVAGDYAYQWLSSPDNITWSQIVLNGNNLDYSPPALTSATYYKRQVTSGECTDISGSTVKVTVLPPISGNTISSDQTVCYNTSPAPLTASALSGGDGSYTYIWQQSADGTTWTDATGINTGATYQPPALTVPMKYKRKAKSGDFDCCSSISNVINVGIHALPTGSITNNADTTVCGGSQVLLKVRLTGASPWNITYRDIISAAENTVSVSSSDGIVTVLPSSPTNLNNYTYSLLKVEDSNGCLATSLTGTKNAKVYKVPVADAGADMIICGPEITITAVPSAGTGTWTYPSAVLSATVNNPSITVTVDSLFQGGNINHKFLWEEINWQCRSKDSMVVNFYKRIRSINAGRDTTLFSFDNVIKLAANSPQSWETGSWSTVTGTGKPDNAADSITTFRELSPGLNTMLWTIVNGPCELNDQIDVTVRDIFIPEGFSPNNDNVNDLFIIKGLDNTSDDPGITPNQTAELKILNGAGTVVFSTSNSGWKDWDGKNSKGLELPEGTYYYLLRITSNNNGQVFKKSGFIILKRY